MIPSENFDYVQLTIPFVTFILNWFVATGKSVIYLEINV